jgi:hypothetical protein
MVRELGRGWIGATRSQVRCRVPMAVERAVQHDRADHDGQKGDEKGRLSIERSRIIRPPALSQARHPYQPCDKQAGDDDPDRQKEQGSPIPEEAILLMADCLDDQTVEKNAAAG